MLYPIDTETREVKDLSGVWEFRVDRESVGRSQQWQAKPLEDTIPMPVPSSYNDITQDASIRDHVGDVWYEKHFFVPASWTDKRVVIRVGSATHRAIVWVNGVEVASHVGGYLPFEADISSHVRFGQENRVSIVVSNILDWRILPPGDMKVFSDDMHPEGFRVQQYYHDYFNYAGLHRPIRLVATPKTFVKDITIATDIDGANGVVDYDVEAEVEGLQAEIQVELLDVAGKSVANASGAKGKLTVMQANLWEPGNAYLYMLVVRLVGASGELIDCYRLPVGIRTVQATETQVLVNGKPVHFKGFGKHEDMDIRGKGLDEALNVKDFNLLKWLGANSFRTSHYPYAEEVYRLADREGIMIIDEVPATGLQFFGAQEGNVFQEGRADDKLLEHHCQAIREMIQRDKNHPSVVMWSLANESATYEDGAVKYFETIVALTRQLDPTRPVTMAESTKPHLSKTAQLFDVICFNRYYSWYEDAGQLELIEAQCLKELTELHERFNKPLIMSEYGADTIEGLHRDPPAMFSEEYQCELLRRNHAAFDKMPFLVGEHVWNFADFATKQGITRVGGNKKGVFTRNRHPKLAAHLLRKRWCQER